MKQEGMKPEKLKSEVGLHPSSLGVSSFSESSDNLNPTECQGGLSLGNRNRTAKTAKNAKVRTGLTADEPSAASEAATKPDVTADERRCTQIEFRTEPDSSVVASGTCWRRPRTWRPRDRSGGEKHLRENDDPVRLQCRLHRCRFVLRHSYSSLDNRQSPVANMLITPGLRGPT
jgi:hypothetical protein